MPVPKAKDQDQGSDENGQLAQAQGKGGHGARLCRVGIGDAQRKEVCRTYEVVLVPLRSALSQAHVPGLDEDGQPVEGGKRDRKYQGQGNATQCTAAGLLVEQDDQIDAQDGGKDEGRQAVGDYQGGEQQGRQGCKDEPVLSGGCDQAVKCPEHQGEPDKGQELGDCTPHVEIHQVIGQVGIDDGSYQGPTATQVQAGKSVHAQRRSDQPRGKDQFERQGRVNTQQREGQSPVVAQRPVEVENRMAVAKGELGEPAGVQDAGPHGPVEGLQAIDVEQAIVRVEKASTRQWHEGGQRQQHHPPGRGDGTQFAGPRTNTLVHVTIIARAKVLGK